MDTKRGLIGLSIAVTVLWVGSILFLSAESSRTPSILEFATLAFVPVAVWWSFLYLGFWLMRGSAVQTFIFGISALTFVGGFFFALGYTQYASDLDGPEAFMLSMSMGFGLGCLVAAFLTYHHRAELAPPPPGAQQVPQPPRTQQTPPPPGTQQTPPPPQ